MGAADRRVKLNNSFSAADAMVVMPPAVMMVMPRGRDRAGNDRSSDERRLPIIAIPASVPAATPTAVKTSAAVTGPMSAAMRSGGMSGGMASGVAAAVPMSGGGAGFIQRQRQRGDRCDGHYKMSQHAPLLGPLLI